MASEVPGLRNYHLREFDAVEVMEGERYIVVEAFRGGAAIDWREILFKE